MLLSDVIVAHHFLSVYLLVRLFFLLETTMATSSLDFRELVPLVDLPDDETSSTLLVPLDRRAMTESVLSPL